MVRNADFRYSRSHCPSQNTFAKVQTQDLTAKKSTPEEFKLKEVKPADVKSSVPPRSDEVV